MRLVKQGKHLQGEESGALHFTGITKSYCEWITTIKTTVELHTAKLLGKKSIPESITLGSICQEELKLTHKHKPKSYTLTSYLEQKKHA